MKKIFLVLALAAVAQFAVAQESSVKSPATAKAAVEKARTATENPKLNVKAATWIKYGQALLDAYNSPMGNGWVGMTVEEWKFVGGGEKPVSETQVEIGGQQLTKQAYDARNYYFTRDGQLSAIEVTKPVIEDALARAFEAFREAAKLDAGGKAAKTISEALKQIAAKYSDEAYNAYAFGDYAKASDLFEKTYTVSGTAPYSVLDTNSLYNAAFAAMAAADTVRAKAFFTECLAKNYAAADGEVYARLADIANKSGDVAASKSYLEEGFSKYPQSQSILIGLINYYMTSGENTGRLFELLDDAKKNEPGNASLYYVEGNIHEKLGEEEAAVAAWDKCAGINPAYEFGYIGKALHFYNKALECQEKASSEMDDAKYQILVSEFENALKSCIEPFEKAYEITKDQTVKDSVTEYLRNACFRFREDPVYQAKYDKYSAEK